MSGGTAYCLLLQFAGTRWIGRKFDVIIDDRQISGCFDLVNIAESGGVITEVQQIMFDFSAMPMSRISERNTGILSPLQSGPGRNIADRPRFSYRNSDKSAIRNSRHFSEIKKAGEDPA